MEDIQCGEIGLSVTGNALGGGLLSPPAEKDGESKPSDMPITMSVDAVQGYPIPSLLKLFVWLLF